MNLSLETSQVMTTSNDRVPIVILYHPPFRNIDFPIEILSNAQRYRFFILLLEEDLDSHKKFINLHGIEDVIPVKFEIDHLIKMCDKIVSTHGPIRKFVYLAEECVRLAGQLGKHYGIERDHLDRYIDKDLMARKLKEAGIRVPKSLLFNDTQYHQDREKYISEIERSLGEYPFFIKPSDLCGSVRTCKVHSKEELINWAQEKFPHSYLIQEYIEGTLFHCEGFVQNSQAKHFSVFEYSHPGFFFSQGLPVGSISLPNHDPLAQRISHFTEQVLEKLGIIENGVTHAEIFLNRHDELICLEVAARPPGLAAERLYEKHLNLSINRTHFELQLGCYSGDLSHLNIENYAVRYIFPFPSSGRITRFADRLDLHSEFHEIYQFKIGDEAKKSADLFNVASTMVLWNKDYLLLREDFKKLKNYIPFEIEC
ncbi:MAG: ATP-grasp domain-containing protein [Chlamydiales bacterium]|nr:ATP-grasp domain-containing protein [Chlamydiales bacterium]